MPTSRCQSFNEHSPHLPSGYSETQFVTRLKTRMQQFVQFLQQLLIECGEPKVWQKFDRQGNSLGWRIFDPETGRTIAFGSELEVRLWLEQRFYR